VVYPGSKREAGGEVSRFTLARTISVVMHPLFLPVGVLLAVAYTESGGLRAFWGWVLIILFFLAALPLTYVFFRSPRGTSGPRRLDDPAAFFREHPGEICILAIICALPCILVMVFLDAPSPLVATLFALLATSLALALVNMRYRASYHLAAVTTLAIAAVLVWGQGFLPVLAAVPIVGWALYSLRRHSPAQLAVGLGLALTLSTACFYFFGLLGDFFG
jgi:hypothetical protein